MLRENDQQIEQADLVGLPLRGISIQRVVDVRALAAISHIQSI